MMSTNTSDASTASNDEYGTDATDTAPDESDVGSAEIGDEERRETVSVDHSPSRFSQLVTVGAALLGAGMMAPFSGFSIPFGIVGVLLVGMGIGKTYSRRWVSVGVAMILVGALISGAYGFVPAELILVGVGATLIAWDVGQHGLSVGEHLGRQTQTVRLETVHAASTTLFVGCASIFTYAVYLAGGTGQPASAVALALTGVILVLWTFRS